MPAPGHPFPRYLYAIELALFALPTVGVLAPFLGLLAFFSYGGFIVSVVSLATSGSDSLEHVGFTLAGSFLVTAALVALWQFTALSAAYLSGDPVRSPRHRRKFRIGALLATPPTLFAVAIAIHRRPSPLLDRLCKRAADADTRHPSRLCNAARQLTRDLTTAQEWPTSGHAQFRCHRP
jgi:hypothetical protein